METRGNFLSARRIAELFFLMGVFFKQLYLFRNGSFQIGDALLMISFLFLLLVRDWEGARLDKRDYWLVAFVGCTVLINGIYTIIYGTEYKADFWFHMSILNYVYILFVVLAFRQFCEDRFFLRWLRRVLEAAVLIQTVLCVLDLLPRYADIRFVGTFNDPNQCGFYVMSAFFLIYMCSKMTGEGFPWIWLIPAFYCISETSSTGMMMGLIIFVVLALFFQVFGKSEKAGVAMLVTAVLLFSGGMLVATGRIHLSDSYKESFVYQRIMGKIANFGMDDSGSGSMDLDSFIEDRSLQKLALFPERILYGAGEGYFERFNTGENSRQELHSSLLGPLFYYGIIPCVIWFVWIGLQLKGSKRELWSVYLALMIESFTLVNNRQPFFWMIFALAGSCLAKKRIREKEFKEAEWPKETEEGKQERNGRQLQYANQPEL